MRQGFFLADLALRVVAYRHPAAFLCSFFNQVAQAQSQLMPRGFRGPAIPSGPPRGFHEPNHLLLTLHACGPPDDRRCGRQLHSAEGRGWAGTAGRGHHRGAHHRVGRRATRGALVAPHRARRRVPQPPPRRAPRGPPRLRVRRLPRLAECRPAPARPCPPRDAGARKAAEYVKRLTLWGGACEATSLQLSIVLFIFTLLGISGMQIFTISAQVRHPTHPFFLSCGRAAPPKLTLPSLISTRGVDSLR